MKNKRVVVIGGGVAGRAFAVAASRFPQLSVVVVDPLGHPAFENLAFDRKAQTYSVSDTVLPRTVWEKGVATEIDTTAGVVRLRHKQLPFDFVVVASGAKASFDRVPGAAQAALSPWRIDDRMRIVSLFEAARDVVRRGVSNSVQVSVIGGGRVGVSVAGHVLDFTSRIQVPVSLVLVEQHSRLLSDLPMSAARAAEQVLVKRGVTVQCGHRVTAFIEHQAFQTEEGARVPFEICIWAADHDPVCVPVVRDGKSGGVAGGVTDSHFRVRPHEQIYALGDAALPPVPHRGPTQGYIFEEALYLSETIALTARNHTVLPFAPRRHVDEVIFVGGGYVLSVEAEGCRVKRV
ncbi:MAG: FAD-dependent oxidoreductase [Candidatus Doudnabacteria bacterium]|nr:FAD-dependent oxidoreductase [Candidatus Doudnabacteria bacterium]